MKKAMKAINKCHRNLGPKLGQNLDKIGMKSGQNWEEIRMKLGRNRDEIGTKSGQNRDKNSLGGLKNFYDLPKAPFPLIIII